MEKFVQSNVIDINLFNNNEGLLEECIKEQRVHLFKSLAIADDQPVVLTFRSTRDNDLLANLGDPLGRTVLKTQMNVEIPQTRHVVITKSIYEDYKEYKGFWAKLKLLFSKKSVYTKESREV